MPPPTGVVSGPLIEIRKSRTASTVSSGSHCLNSLNAFSPANTSNQAIFRFTPYARLTAASNTRWDAFQMSRPVPSPSMKGMMGLSGITNLPPTYWIACPSDGMGLPLYDGFMSMFLCGLSLQQREQKRITHPAARGHIECDQNTLSAINCWAQIRNETTSI